MTDQDAQIVALKAENLKLKNQLSTFSNMIGFDERTQNLWDGEKWVPVPPHSEISLELSKVLTYALFSV